MQHKKPQFLILFLFLSILVKQYAAAASPPTLHAPTQAPEPHLPRDGIPTTPTEDIPTEGPDTLPPDPPLVQRDQQTPGSPCPGAEGQWNCMTTSWQRCAAGKWSVVMQCAAGTVCVPAGLTYDFRVQFSGQGDGGGSSGGSASGTGGRFWRGWVWGVVVGGVVVYLCV